MAFATFECRIVQCVCISSHVRAEMLINLHSRCFEKRATHSVQLERLSSTNPSQTHQSVDHNYFNVNVLAQKTVFISAKRQPPFSLC